MDVSKYLSKFKDATDEHIQLDKITLVQRHQPPETSGANHTFGYDVTIREHRRTIAQGFFAQIEVNLFKQLKFML